MFESYLPLYLLRHQLSSLTVYQKALQGDKCTGVKTGDPHPLDLELPSVHFEVYSSFLIPFNTFRRQ